MSRHQCRVSNFFYLAKELWCHENLYIKYKSFTQLSCIIKTVSQFVIATICDVVGNEKFDHYSDVIMSTMASQITGVSIVSSTVVSGADQRKHQSSASLAFVWGIHRWPVNSPHKGPVTRKMFPFDDVIMVMTTLGFQCMYGQPLDQWYIHINYTSALINTSYLAAPHTTSPPSPLLPGVSLPIASKQPLHHTTNWRDSD